MKIRRILNSYYSENNEEVDM
jgi:hypothetical protein